MKVKSSGWQDEAIRELTEELKLDPDSIKTGSGPTSDSVELKASGASNGEKEWVIFKNDTAAERYAIEYVREMLEDDPVSFNQGWLEGFLFIRPGDIGIIAREDADSYYEDMSDDEILDHSGHEHLIDEITEQIDVLEQKVLELGEQMKQADEAGDDDTYDMLSQQLDDVDATVLDLEQQKEPIIDDAREYLIETRTEEIERILEKNPLEYAQDLGYGFGQDMPSWMSIDFEEAAQDAIKTDGVAHFLDSYDGYEEEVPSGAVAFGTN